MNTLLSVDLGTTGCKAALYSTAGVLLGSHTVEYSLIHTGPGYVEQDAELWWRLTMETIQGAILGSGVDPQTVAALSASTQGISFVPVDASGRVLRNAINWLDMRATNEAAEIEDAVGADTLFQITGKRPSAAYVLPKILWLRAHEPHVYRDTAKFLMAHDYLLFRCCGATVTDYSMAGGSALLDIGRLDWSADLLAIFDVDRGKLPDLAWAGTIAGRLDEDVARLLGLAPGLPVVVGGQDQKCAALGAGIHSGVATVSLGTASAISGLVDRPVLDAGQRIPTFPFVIPGFWDLEGVVSTAGAALKWLGTVLFPGTCYSSLDALAERSVPGAHGVRFYPHLTGATSPLWQKDARGAFLGLTLASDAGDIVRSVLEGIAYQIRANLDVIEALTPVEGLILFGGGARSRLWAGIIAAIAAKPVRVTEIVDVANWGACVLAGAGAGLFDPVVDLTASVSASIVPQDQDVAEYEALFREYVDAERVVIAG